MKARTCRWLLFLIVAAATALAPAHAGLDIDLGASVRLNDNTDIYFAVSSRYFGEDRLVVERFGVRYGSPDDLAVALFIARHSGQSQAAIYRLRRQGLTWWDISVRLGVPADVWFVRVERDPGPPYGKAWGYWKKRGKDRPKTIVLTDDECRGFVAVRLVHEYYGVPVETAVEWRNTSRDLKVLISDEYRQRHGKSRGKALHAAGKGSSKGKNKKH
jgi:hypothetical protein